MRYLGYLVLSCIIWGAIPAPAAPVDVIVLFVDHWEPNSVGDTPPDIQHWCDTYRAFADRHRDSDGRPLRHSFFYWNYETLRQWTRPSPLTALPVLQLVYDGYGEIDLHVHHNELGTAEANRQHLVDATRSFIADCRRWGMFTTAEAVPRTRFAFIHGMWALDNSRRLGGLDGQQPQYCGVDTELDALRELGCYADFTFPSHNVMDPQVRNEIFYARDDDKGWSYGNPDNITPVRVGLPPSDNLMIFEGPHDPIPSSQALGAMTPDGFDKWVATGVHVDGQPNWIFVKIHTHGVQQQGVGIRSTTSEGTSTLWGDEAEAFWSHVEAKYSDGRRYRVHYMSAREAYNVVRAAQDGRTGNPFDYRDYTVAPYASSVLNSGGTYVLESWQAGQVVLRRQESVESAAFSLRTGQATPVVEESPDGVVWAPSEGTVAVLGGSLQVADETPSEFYRVIDLGPAVKPSSPKAPLSDRLGPGAPNPFSQRVALSYRSGAPTPVRIDVFDVRGRLVRRLLEGPSIVGEGIASWDGRDGQGRMMPDGIYLCRMTTDRSVLQQTVVLVQ